MREEQAVTGVKSGKKLSMTPEAIRKREERQKKRRKEEIEARGGESISEMWQRNSKLLLEENPKLHEELQNRHVYVVWGLEADVTEIEKGVGLYLWPHSVGKKRLETDDTAGFENTFALDPCLAFAEIKADIQKNGILNYYAVERMRDEEDAKDFRPAFGTKYDGAPESAYRLYGFRLRVEHDTLQRIREGLVIYGLVTGDKNLDWAVVEEAIADCSAYNGFSGHADWLKQLIREHRQQSAPAPLSQKELLDRTLNDLHNAGLGATSL